jgi:hypothetical protein
MPAVVISQIPPVPAHLATASSGYLHLFAGFETFSQHLAHASSGYLADSDRGSLLCYLKPYSGTQIPRH